MSRELFTYELPVYWASYLINGDDSGLEPGERQEIDTWLAKQGLDRGDAVDCGEPYFSWNNDANGIGGDVAEFTFLIPQPCLNTLHSPVM